MAHISRLHHVRDCAHRVFYGHAGIEPRGTVDVKEVGAKPLQRIGQESLDRDRSRIDTNPATGGVAQCTEFNGPRLLERGTRRRRGIIIAGSRELTSHFSPLTFSQSGVLVYRLGHGPLKAERRVRFPCALPTSILSNRINDSVSFLRFQNTLLLTLTANKSIVFSYVCRW